MTCKNCSKTFEITPDDAVFYEKIKVPPPTWCPECRAQRRFLWRNERILYKRLCNAPGHTEQVISNYASEVPMPVYDQRFWWSDAWDPMQYGREYDFTKPFFEQFKELLSVVPLPNVTNLESVNSDYCNFTYQSKNCYLNFASDINEDTGYLYHTMESKNSFDLLSCKKMERCYEAVHSTDCYNCAYVYFSTNCIDSRYMYACHNCQDCFGCVNVRNGKYQIFNQQYSKEEYKKELARIVPKTYEEADAVFKKFQDFQLQHPHRFAQVLKAENVTGDYIINAKNCRQCFDVEGPAENLAYVTYSLLSVKDCRDGYGLGAAELGYEITSAGAWAHGLYFSPFVWTGGPYYYSHFCKGCSDVFGCISLRDKKYCILNKQYTKEDYEALMPKIIEHMKSTGEYGEFFSPDVSPFAYNETIAQEFNPLTKEQILAKGHRWKDREQTQYQIKDDVIGCDHAGTCKDQCTTAFKMISAEIEFYQRMNLSLPRLCPNCRHYARLKQRNPLKLWHRQCMKCGKDIETSYSPDRKEIVYCESCYQQEVA